jgi:hypothetical protein
MPLKMRLWTRLKIQQQTLPPMQHQTLLLMQLPMLPLKCSHKLEE